MFNLVSRLNGAARSPQRAATWLALALLLATATTACGADSSDTNTPTTADSSTADGAVTDGAGGEASDVATQGDVSVGSDGGAGDAGEADGGAQLADSASGKDDAGATGGDAGTKPTFGCKGTLRCSFYAKIGDMKQCQADPGCTPAGLGCRPVSMQGVVACQQQTSPGACSDLAKMGCKWVGNKCYFTDYCTHNKSQSACAGEKNAACTWAATSCAGFAEKNSCAKAPNQQGCQLAPGCQWTDCEPSNGGVEVCDGVDNDCDGVTDNGNTPKGAICDDGDKCNGMETCVKGSCKPGLGLKCAGKACHDATCDKAKGCVYTANTAPCEDGNKCTSNDACKDGKCAAGAPKKCDDGDACTKDTCDAKTGACKSVADGVAACDDNNVCTDDSCDAKTGCKHVNNTKPCSDGDACTGGGGGGKTGKTGKKGPSPLPGGDVCAQGSCTPGPKVVCNDGNACTDDSCDKLKGCVKLNNAIACNDGNTCTSGEKCAGGACTGGVNKCDDKNICTADSCDSAGACKNTAIPGCKTCTSATQCNDNNNCTKDACTAGKCTHTQINGCIGPTDYQPTALVPVKSPVALPGGFSFKLTVKNLGKKYLGSFSNKMVWTIYLSADNKIDTAGAAADKKLYGRKWDGYNIGAPKVISYTITKGVSIQDPTWAVGKKYACVRLTGGGDSNLSNNDLCVPVTFLLPNFKALTFTPPTSFTAGQPIAVKFSFKNEGGDSNAVAVDFYHSTDAVFDENDMKVKGYGFNRGAVKAGATHSTSYLKIYTQPAAQSTHKYLCMLVNTYASAWKKESNTKDNAICKPVTVINKPDIAYNASALYFRDAAGKNYANVPYGTVATCGVSVIANVSYGDLDGSFPIRCWLSDDGKTQYGNSKNGWQSMFTWTGKIPGKKNVKTVLGDKFTKIAPAKVGAKWLCADMNHDKKVAETNYANRHCRKIAVTGVDLFVDPSKTKFGATSWKLPQPTTLKRGVAHQVEFIYCNQGNVALSAKSKGLEHRMVLSKDQVISADDFVIWKESKFLFNSLGGLNQYGKPACGSAANQSPKVTIPTSVTPGQYYILSDINYDKKYPEPMANNLLVKAVTIQ